MYSAFSRNILGVSLLKTYYKLKRLMIWYLSSKTYLLFQNIIDQTETYFSKETSIMKKGENNLLNYKAKSLKRNCTLCCNGHEYVFFCSAIIITHANKMQIKRGLFGVSQWLKYFLKTHSYFNVFMRYFWTFLTIYWFIINVARVSRENAWRRFMKIRILHQKFNRKIEFTFRNELTPLCTTNK